MAKRRKQKPVPEHLKRIEAAPSANLLELDGADRIEAAKASCRWHNETIKKRRLWLEVWEREYKDGGNPLAVWDAYLTVREMRWEIPGWILEYFEKVGAAMLNPRSKPSNLPLYLGFDLKAGGAGFFEQYRRMEIRRYAIAWVLNELEEDPEQSIGSACSSAVEAVKERYAEDIDQDTINKWYCKMEA